MIQLCQICSADGKYRCPACSCVTCSLTCVNTHKKNSKCSGVRNRVKMVSKRNYTEEHLMSDFTLLEEAGRAVNAADRTLDALMSGKGISGGLMNRLTQEAAKRNIRLSFMPKGFARHSRNTSQVKSAPKSRVLASGLKGAHMIFWHIDVYFAGLSIGSNQLVKVESCAEDYNIETIVKGALTTLQKRNKRRRTDVHSVERNTAALYEKSESNDLSVYLQNEHVTSTIPAVHTKGFAANSDCDMHRYVLLDQTITLLQCLKGRAIIEFPVLYIAAKGSAAAERLSKTTFGLFEKPEPDAMSDSSASSDSSDDESVAGTGQKNKVDVVGNATQGKVSDGKIAEKSDIPGTSKIDPTDVLSSKKAPESALEKTVEEQAVVIQSEKKVVASNDEGKAADKNVPSERRSEGRKFSRFGSPSEKNGGETGSKVQKHPAPETSDLDLVPVPAFDHATHPTGLFDLPLPEGRVPRKPKAIV